jgi:TonB-dependent starch-binding outer membrane protein SusC
MKNYLRLIVAFSFALLTAFQGYSQGSVRGAVTDDQGEPLIGATILLVGTARGTATDFDGTYLLENVPAGEQQIRASYTGYNDITKTVAVRDGQESVLNFQLGEDVKVLEEVVVIGYGTQRRGDATGVITAVSDKNFNRGAIVSPDQLLVGKVAGVQITSNSGEPGGQSSIRIRGGTSVNASNEPLYVIDGVPIDNAPHNPGGFSNGRNPLNFLNPSDIETFTVLKDASAAAIYGSRGANGVIIITTKKGKAGARPRLNYDGYYTTATVDDQPPVLDAEAFRNVVTFKAPERLNTVGNANTNWMEEILQTSTGQNHALSFTGGGENFGYRVSAGYQQLKGVVRSSETERTSFGLNYNHSLFDNRLIINTNLKGAFTKDQYDPGAVGSAWRFDPTQPVYDPNNTTYAGFFEYGNPLAPRNPVSGIEQSLDFGKNFRSIGNMEMEYKLDDLVPGLSAKLNLGFDVTNGERKRFQPTTYVRPPISDYTGEIRFENITRGSKLLDFYLNYNKALSDVHRIDVTAGYSYQDFRGEFPSFRAFNLNTDIFQYNSTNPATDFEANNSVVENRLISFFGRANYALMDKYLLTVTVRRDGSTRFSEANRWGLFPSAAFAWRILEEGFADGLRGTLSDLKLRLGYGITGNQDIGDFRYLPTYTFSNFRARYQFGDEFVTTARPNGYDANLKWEETSSYNIGLDAGFSNGRIRGSIEYYYKRTKDLLFTVNVPAGTNLTDRVLTNIGEVENQGIELTLDAAVLAKPDLSWDLGFNIARNNNKILAIDRVSTQGILTGGISGGVGNFIQILQVGQPVNSFFVFTHKLGADGLPLIDGVDHNDDGQVNLADIYEDTNNDGRVDDLDKQPYKQPAPDYILGLTSNFAFKGFDLNFTLRANLGNYVYNNNSSDRGYFDYLTVSGVSINNLHQSTLETKFTRPQYFSDYYVEDASFLRMDNITLGYTFLPKSVFSNIRLYATAQNLFVLTEYSGVDPEVGGGIDNFPYPRARGFIFGLSFGF